MRHLAAAAVAMTVVGACVGESPPPGAAVTVTLREWSIAHSENSVPGFDAVIAVHNVGTQTHHLLVVRTDAGLQVSGGMALPLAPLDMAKLDSLGAIALRRTIPSGAGMEIPVDLRPGRYLLLCDIPSHYAAGMHAWLEARWR